jgi:complex III assembly factor LYRM7
LVVSSLDDNAALTAATNEIKRKFREEPDDLNRDIKHAQDVALILKHNVVQAKKDASGRYKLNLHKDTELGDNSSIKTGKSVH